jgi:restriction system protein
MTNAPTQTETVDKFGWNEGDPETVQQGNGNTSPLPKYDDLFKPTLETLTKLGGSGSIEELDEALTAAIGASQEQLDVTYPKSGAAVLPARMKWARSYLKIAGLVANPKQGVWVLTDEGRIAATKSPAELKQIVRAADKSWECWEEGG